MAFCATHLHQWQFSIESVVAQYNHEQRLFVRVKLFRGMALDGVVITEYGLVETLEYLAQRVVERAIDASTKAR